MEKEEEWEEGDDRVNLRARGSEMRRKRRRRAPQREGTQREGVCARCSPLSRMVSCCLHKHTDMDFL